MSYRLEILAYGGVLVVAYLVLSPLIHYLRDPLKLRRYPSPSWVATCTPIWLTYVTWSQRRSRILHEEFQRLGDVIRVAPNQIIFTDPAAIKDIYGVLATSRGVFKDEFYDRLAGDAHDLVQLRDRGAHSSRRKAIAHAFAANTVVNMETVIRDSLHKLFCVLDEHANPDSEPLNLRKWLNFFTLDVIGDTAFGEPMGFIESGRDSAAAQTHAGAKYNVPETIETLHRGVRYAVTMANLTPLILMKALKYLATALPPVARRVGSACATDFERICIEKLRGRIWRGVTDRSSGDFMAFILDDKRSQPISLTGTAEAFQSMSIERFRVLVADSAMVINAGSDTTAAALTSTIWFLLQNPVALSRLREELSSAVDGSNGRITDITDSSAEMTIFPYDIVKDLSYLRACIDESLRLRPPIAYQLPRLVSQPIKIAGHDVLPGTVVAVAPYSVHRYPSLYRDPDKYRPERWLEYDEKFPSQIEDLKKYNIVFSQGSRACIGRHLAIIELQILISSIFMRYNLELTADSAKELKVFERFNSNPGPMLVNLHRKQTTA